MPVPARLLCSYPSFGTQLKSFSLNCVGEVMSHTSQHSPRPATRSAGVCAYYLPLVKNYLLLPKVTSKLHRSDNCLMAI